VRLGRDKFISWKVIWKQLGTRNIKLSNTQILFGKSTTEDLDLIDEKTLLSVFEGVPQVTIDKSIFENVNDVTDLLSETTDGVIFPSKGEARRMIKGGGVSINKTRLNNPAQEANFNLLNDRYLLVQKGKKNYYLVIIE